MNLGDSLITIIAIGLAAVLMFIFPLMSLADRSDDITQLAAQSATRNFGYGVTSTGQVSLSDYTAFEQEISATGNSYEIEMEVKVLDENPGKKTTQASSTKIGENVYYSMYTSQILDALDDGNAVLALKEGDIFSVSVKNTNTTLSQQLKNFFYTVAGNDTYTIAAEYAGYVTANGS